MTGCPANLPLTHAPGQQHDTPFQAVVVEAHHCHQPQAFYAQLRQQGLTAIHFIPQLAAGDAALWGEFLCAVFHRWVREDIGRINILLFSETLSAWCGETLTQPGAPAANSTCYGCPWLRLCRCGEQEDPLCAGYRQFYDFSGPYMRVMRDLRRQQRPPEALMPLLALAVSFLISFGVTFALNMPNMTLPLFLLLLVVGLFYPKYGKSEMNNKNANTSGVVALLEVAKALTPRYRGEVCFLFLDGGTQGSKGAKRLIHAHPELKKKSVVVLDCVGEGDELLILPGKASRWNDKLLDTILEQFSNSERKTCFLKTDGLVHYPSDNRAFMGGTVICACKKVKGFGRCILPRKIEEIDEENLSLLCDGLCKLVMYYNPQNT